MSEDKKETSAENKAKKGGNMVFLVLGLLIVAGIAALAFVSNTVIAEQNGETQANVQTASGDSDASTPTETAAEKPAMEIKEGNPVVAKMGDEEIKRNDVLMFIAQLPAQMRQQPLDQLFPLALEQTINAKLLEREAEKSDVKKDEQVVAQIKEANESLEAQKAEVEKNIVRTAYVQKLVNEGVSEDAMKAEYEEYKSGFKSEEEVKARHILLETEDAAKAVIKKLDEGADFEELAKSESTGPSAPNGGDLGYFTKGQMVPAFSDEAFAMKKGEHSSTPVQTDFGYHVILVEDRRQSEPMSLEEVRPFIEQELKRDVLDEKLQTWRKELNIETYDINGEPVETSATNSESENEG